MLESPRDLARPERSPILSMLLSIIAPGFGHFYLGELVKGAVVLGVFILCCVVLALASGTKELIRQFLILITLGYGMPVEGPKEPIGLVSVFFSGILIFTYIYAVVDAPLIASKRALLRRREQESQPKPDPPKPHEVLMAELLQTHGEAETEALLDRGEPQQESEQDSEQQTGKD